MTSGRSICADRNNTLLLIWCFAFVSVFTILCTDPRTSVMLVKLPGLELCQLRSHACYMYVLTALQYFSCQEREWETRSSVLDFIFSENKTIQSLQSIVNIKWYESWECSLVGVMLAYHAWIPGDLPVRHEVGWM